MSARLQLAANATDGSKPPAGKQGKPPPPPDLKRNLPGWPSQQWAPMVLYFIFMLGMLWFWQEESGRLATRTIPYSEFKDLAAQGRVAALTIGETDITGEAFPTAAAAEKSNLMAATNSGISMPTNAMRVANTNESGLYLFRTVRVEDPDLVADLRRARIEFAGTRPGVMTQLIWAWVIPIAVMVLLWRFLARRVGSIGQGIMSIGSSRARVVAENDTGVTFNDVAGCDEAKYELQEVVTFLKNPDRYKVSRRVDSQRHPADRSARHRQNPSGARRGRGSQGPVFSDQRQRFCGDVRRRGRGPRPRLV